MFFWASVLGIIISSITVLAASADKQPAGDVFASWDNKSGWNPGLTFMLAVGQSMWSYVYSPMMVQDILMVAYLSHSFSTVDGATHVAEEIPRPGINIPRAMLLSMLIGFLTSVFFSAAILFSCSDFVAIIEAKLPIYEAYLQAIRSPVAAAFLSSWIILLFFGATLGLITTSGRIIWAFSRDNGMPFSHIFREVHQRLKVPANANVLTCFFCLAYGCIYIGSSVAFNTFISSSVLFMNLSYAIPQGLLLAGDRNRLLPKRGFYLGNIFGIFCNVFSVAWVSLYLILFCFPLYLPADSTNMNYVSVVVFATFLILMLLWYIGGKKGTFVGPQVDVESIKAISTRIQTPNNWS